MAYQLIWLRSARLDLHDLLAYIAEDDPLAARNFAQGVLARLSDWRSFLNPVVWCRNLAKA